MSKPATKKAVVMPKSATKKAVTTAFKAVVISFVRSFFKLLEPFRAKVNPMGDSSYVAIADYWDNVLSNDENGLQVKHKRGEKARNAFVNQQLYEHVVQHFSYLPDASVARNTGNDSVVLQVSERIGVVNTTLRMCGNLFNGALFADYAKFTDAKGTKQEKKACDTYLAAKHGEAIKTLAIAGENTNGTADINYALFDKNGTAEAFITGTLEALTLADKGDFKKASALLLEVASGIKCDEFAQQIANYADEGFTLACVKAKVRQSEDDIKSAKADTENASERFRVWLSVAELAGVKAKWSKAVANDAKKGEAKLSRELRTECRDLLASKTSAKYGKPQFTDTDYNALIGV